MMKSIMLAITLVLALVAAVLTQANPARSQPNQFIINNADGVEYVSTTESAELNGLISGIGPRFVVEFANGIKYYGLTPFSSELQDLLQQVPERFVIQYANADRFYNLSYPFELIGDTIPPQISDLAANGSGLVQWKTDEYATGEVRYGTQSGIYPYSINDPLFSTSHLIRLTDLVPNTTYYYIVVCTDRSGNTAESIEQILLASQLFYLPVVRR
jgi:hypothetical protein